MSQIWKLRNGMKALVDEPPKDSSFRKLLHGVVLAEHPFTFLWDETTGFGWGPEEWDLVEKLEEISNNER